MRSLSFATLHRVVWSFARTGRPVAAREINAVVNAEREGAKGAVPSLTTLYRYRATLQRLGLMHRATKRWTVNLHHPVVAALAEVPPSGDSLLCATARSLFVDLVLSQPDCRSLFFDLFMPGPGWAPDSVAFCTQAAPVAWRHVKGGRTRHLELSNEATAQHWRHVEPQAALAILYGLRYWARDELRMIDEYAELGRSTTVWFPISAPADTDLARKRKIFHAVRFLLAKSRPGPWTTHAISDLIAHYCIPCRESRSVLFSAIDWLCRWRSNRIALVPTPLAVATLASSSASREHLELTRYYRDPCGRLISDIRIHTDTEPPPAPLSHEERENGCS